MKGLPRTLILALVFLGFTNLFAQSKSDSRDARDGVRLSATFQFHDVVKDDLDLKYFGLSAELYRKQVAFSGAILYGTAAGGDRYLHIPLAGPVVVLLLAVENLTEGEARVREGFKLEYLAFLLLENIHYSFRITPKFVLSPYLSLLSTDICLDSSCPDAGSTGAGVNLKMLINEKLFVSSDVALKYFFFAGAEENPASQFGYTLGIHLGYVF